MVSKVEVNRVYLQDVFLQGGDLTEQYEEIFRLVQQPSRSYEFDEKVLAEVKYEMNFDVLSIYRNVYSALDVLKDVGGLSTSVLSFFGIVVMILNYHKEKFEYGIVMFSKRELRDRCIKDGDFDENDKNCQDLELPLTCDPFQLIKLNILGGKKKA